MVYHNSGPEVIPHKSLAIIAVYCISDYMRPKGQSVVRIDSVCSDGTDSKDTVLSLRII